MAKKKSAIVKGLETRRTTDSFQNFMASVGHGTGNQNDGSHYGFHPVSRNRTQMEWAYRGSWIVGRMVDVVAQDMTKNGVELNTTDDPDKIAELTHTFDEMQVWSQLCETIKWSRLYGGSLAFMMIDGQDPSTPLRMDTLQKGQFKGLLPLDRWLVNPSLQDLVQDMGPEFGLPRMYQTVPDTMGMPLMTVHHSRCIRLGGVKLPYWQRIAENLWGQSVLERLWDRLLAFDSTTTGVAQLVYKAHIRTLKIEELREIISSGGQAYQGLLQQVAMMKTFQTNEGITLLDSTDEFDANAYTFSGLDAVLMQFGEQLAGATEIPLVRLFGQSPSGFSTGDSDLRSYYDSIEQQQISAIGPGVTKLYRVGYISQFGKEPPKVFECKFKPLYQLTNEQKAEHSAKTTSAITDAYEKQLIDRSTGMKELKQASHINGVFTNITDEAIQEAENDPPPTPEALGLVMPEPEPGALPGEKGEEEPKQVEYKPHDAKPFKALDSVGTTVWVTDVGPVGDAEGVPQHPETGRFTHGMGLDPERFDESGKPDEAGDWAPSPIQYVKTKSLREAMQAAHPRTCRAYGELGTIEPWKCQGTQKIVNIKKIGEYRRDHGDPITVVKRNGEHGIVDGHHRAAAAHLQGREVDAHIVDMDAAFNEAADCEAANPGLGALGALHLATELRLKNAPRPKKTKDRIMARLRRLLRLGDA